MLIINPPEIPRLLATVATTTALPSNTYDNGSAGANATITADSVGVWTVDGHDLSDGDTVLVKDEVTAANNGLYDVTVAGGASTKTVLVRDPNMNSGANINGVVIPTSEIGATLANTMWIANATVPVTIGTTTITFQQVSGGGGGSGVSSFNARTGTVTPLPTDYNQLIPTGWFDVIAYGAVGDGSTDDTAAINTTIAALNTNGGGVLYFPQPSVSYLVSGLLTAITANTLVMGDPGAKIAGTVSSSGIFLSLGANCTLRGLQFDVTHTSGDIVGLVGDNSQCANAFFSGGTQASCIHITGNAAQAVRNYFDNVNSTACINVDGGFFDEVHSNVFRSVNAGNGALINVAADTTNFNIISNVNGGGGSPDFGVIVQAGTSDDYIIALNNLLVPYSDGGSGVNKQVALNL